MSLLFLETMWVVVSMTSFQLYNIASEPQKLQSVCYFSKLNNTLEYFESNRILFSVLKGFLKTIFDKVWFLLNNQSGFKPANLRITYKCIYIYKYINIYIYIYIYTYTYTYTYCINTNMYT